MAAPSGNIYPFSAPLLDGRLVSFATFHDQVLLIVNTASQCGFTPQYAGLERLHRSYQHRGLTVLGFPCNQFGRQEPGTAEEIAGFCTQRYGVTFPLFARIDVNGPAAHPLYRFLKASRPGIFGIQRIQWNFTKFLVDRHGHVASRHAPKTNPEALSPPIEALLETH
ncbi:MAG: glutathione peroxidase [Terracidiphilus sp.]